MARLNRRRAGKMRCERRPEGTELCVFARRYGYEGRLYNKSGTDYLPVPTGRARTLKSAMSQARQFIRRVKRGR